MWRRLRRFASTRACAGPIHSPSGGCFRQLSAAFGCFRLVSAGLGWSRLVSAGLGWSGWSGRRAAAPRMRRTPRIRVPGLAQYTSRSGLMSRRMVVAISSIDLWVELSHSIPERRIICSAAATSARQFSREA